MPRHQGRNEAVETAPQGTAKAKTTARNLPLRYLYVQGGYMSRQSHY